MNLLSLKSEVRQEFNRLLDYWLKYSPAAEGFYGSISLDNKGLDTERSAVATSRILWGFSAAALFIEQHPELVQEQRFLSHLKVQADRAFSYLLDHFVDNMNGGVYWNVNADGTALNSTKSMYAQSFFIYGTSTYYRAFKIKKGLEAAKNCFQKVIEKAYDPLKGGYLEALSQQWSPTGDYILCKPPWIKTMNTHLHLLECFTSLYLASKEDEVKFHLEHALEMMRDKIIGPDKYTMSLFLNLNWKAKDQSVSYGHDIEASWLLYEAAEALHAQKKWEALSLEMAKKAVDGLQQDGSMVYEFEPKSKHLNSQRSWWVQAEAMVGFLHAWQLNGKSHFLDKSVKTWEFIKKHLIDFDHGEWFSGVDQDYQRIGNSKANPWKAPYHNLRACMEVYKRLS